MIWCLGLALKYGILSGKANDAVCRRPHPQTHQKRETRLRSLRCRHSLKVRTSRPKLTSTFIFPTHTTQLGSRQRKEEERADFFDEGGFCSQSVPAGSTPIWPDFSVFAGSFLSRAGRALCCRTLRSVIIRCQGYCDILMFIVTVDHCVQTEPY